MDDERKRAFGLIRGPPDDTVFYEVHCDDAGTSFPELELLRTQLLQSAAASTSGYIWQNESFNLRVGSPPWPRRAERPAQDAVAACLWGQTSFGDNIDDEWLITWLLVHLTRQHDRISARAWDTDGEFLLIEAAYTLPPWVKPDAITNRVWIRGGVMHLIPPPTREIPSLPPAPTTAEALQILKSGVDTKAPSQTQAAIAARLAAYPQQIETSVHQAAVVLPEMLAGVLQRNPQLLAPAVLAFHYRDPAEVKTAQKATIVPLEDTVQTVVAFSRCLYAQLVSQHYEVPASFPMPLPSDPDFSASQLGAKLTAGFEILLTRASQQGTGLQDVEANPEWSVFVQQLADRGFFGEALIGTEQHGRLMDDAAKQFRETEAHGRHQALVHRPAEKIMQELRSHIPFDPAQVQAKPQSDSWMTEVMGDMERELKRREEEKEGDQLPSVDPAELANHFKDFLSGEAGFDGADIGAPKPEGGDEDFVDLDEARIWKEMMRGLDAQPQRPSGAAASGSEASSFYGDYSDEDETQAGSSHQRREAPSDRPQRASHQNANAVRRGRDSLSQDDDREGEGSGVLTETDSDDAPDFFGEAYEDALRAEMRESNVLHPAHHPPTADTDEEELAPVDLDMNLVQNLLASYEAQEGLPGPVGNLFGMMGMPLQAYSGKGSQETTPPP